MIFITTYPRTHKLIILLLFKGASLLYMMEKFLGQDTLKRGLNDYLNTHKFSNADTKDLWAVMSKHANHSIHVKV